VAELSQVNFFRHTLQIEHPKTPWDAALNSARVVTTQQIDPAGNTILPLRERPPVDAI
jgi:hypothetical protein